MTGEARFESGRMGGGGSQVSVHRSAAIIYQKHLYSDSAAFNSEKSGQPGGDWRIVIRLKLAS
jgi:hypothetical protein